MLLEDKASEHKVNLTCCQEKKKKVGIWKEKREEKQHFPDVTSEEELIWQWQLDHCILHKTDKTHWDEKIRRPREKKKKC